MSKESDNSSPTPDSCKQPFSAVGRLGMLLLLLSGVFFFSMLSVPLLPIEGTPKVVLAAGLFVAVQVAWWLGAALAGPTAIGTMRSWLRRP